MAADSQRSVSALTVLMTASASFRTLIAASFAFIAAIVLITVDRADTQRL
jgi:hypothetical protein